MNAAADILRRIAEDKRAEVLRLEKQTPLALMRRRARKQKPALDFAASLRDSSRLPVIAEIKRQSPSRGVLRKPFSPRKLAREFADSGAACLSVLTDKKYFGGAGEHIAAAKESGLPVLRKDFMLGEWQIVEARAMGADAVLLIAALLSVEEMQSLAAAAREFKMSVLVEAHDDVEVKAALAIPDALVGINNRNLRTFAVDINTAARLAPKIKKADASRLVVAESGVRGAKDIVKLQAARADAFLIGETLMRAKSPGAALRKLFANF